MTNLVKKPRADIIKDLQHKICQPNLNLHDLTEINKAILEVLLGDKKITQLAALTTMADSFIGTGVDTTDTSMAPSGTNKKYAAPVLAGYIQSKLQTPVLVDNVGGTSFTYATLQAAVAAGKTNIEVVAEFSLPSTPIVITEDTRIYIKGGINLGNFFKGFVVTGCVLYIYSSDSLNTKISIGMPAGACFSGTGEVRTYGIYYKNIGLVNTPLSSCLIHIDNCVIETNVGTNNTGVNLSVAGSTIKNSLVINNSSDNAYYLGAGCQAEDVVLLNKVPGATVFGVIDAGAQQNNLSLTNADFKTAITLTINGTLTGNVTTDANTAAQFTVGDGATISTGTISSSTGIGVPAGFVKFTGASAIAFDCTFNLPVSTTNTATGTLLLASYGGSTWTDGGTGTQGQFNTGSLPNNAAPGTGGLSPFQASLDNVGTLPGHYVNSGAAYTAGKSEQYSIANIIEIASITMLNTERLFVQVGQGFKWDLSTYQIIGAVATALTILLTDGSAGFSYSTAAKPFTSFDINSVINIIGRGGVVQNTSTTANSYIECLGVLLASDIKFLLPNASSGGIKTSPTSIINAVKFTGGGNACDTAILANGGSLSNIELNGNNWASNAILIDTTGARSLYQNIYVDINAPVAVNLQGEATNVFRNMDETYTSAIFTIAIGANSTLINSYADVLFIPTGVTGVKIIGGTYATVEFAPDNTTQVDFIGTTFTQAPIFYGKVKCEGCHYLAGGSTDAGSSVIITGSDCGEDTTFVINGGKIRAGNDSIIGNDYGGSTATISEWDADVDGSGSEASHYATFNAAVESDTSEILMTADTSLTADVVFTKPVRLKLLGHKLTLNGFTINCKTYDFVVEGVNSDNSGIVVSATNITEAIFSDSDPDDPTANLILRNVYVDMSAVTTADCSLGTTLALSTNQGTKLIASNVDSSGFTYDRQFYNGFGNDLQMEVPAGFSSCERAVILSSLAVVNTLDVHTQDTADSQVLVSVLDSSILNQMSYSSANISGMTIEVDNIINAIEIFSESVSTININVLSDGAVVRDATLGAGVVDCASKNDLIFDNVTGGLLDNIDGNNIYFTKCVFTFSGLIEINGNKCSLDQCRFSTSSAVYLTGQYTFMSDCYFNQLVNRGHNTSLSNCYSVQWTEDTGTNGRLSQTCQGAIPNSAVAKQIVSITPTESPYTAVVNQLITADVTSGAITILLPPASGDNLGRDIYVSTIGVNTVTFTPDGADTILGLSTKDLTGNGSAYTFAAVSGDWRIF